jgi:hypothetical protein
MRMGLRPMVLEKAKTLGGGTVNSYGLIWVGQNHLARAAGYGDTRDETIAYVRFLGGGSVGVELHPAGGSSVGLLADARGQVIHQRRHPIPGLYASGNVAAATEHGVGYQAGFSLASAMTFSYLAVRHMIDSTIG